MQAVEVKKSHVCCGMKALLVCCGIAMAAFTGCASSKSSAYMLYYQRIGAWFETRGQGSDEVTDLYIDCQRQVEITDCSFRLLIDGSLAANVSPCRNSELKLESRGFTRKGDVFRLSYEGGFIEIRMSGQRVAAIAIKKEIADKGPQIEVCITRGLVHEMPTVISLPVNVAQIESNLRRIYGAPSWEGQVE